jgi:hypothetical protein
MKLNQLFLATLLIAGIGACTNNKRTASSELNHYVDSMNKANPNYTEENWIAIDNGYQERAVRAEAELADMSEADKKALEASRERYAELKAKYEVELQKNQPVIDSKVALRNSLFGAGNVGDDMSFDFVNSTNMLSVYQSFVDAVDANKANYSREDWDEIKLLYETLDTHKNKDEKDLPSGDNMKIAGLKIKMAGMYTTHRPGSKEKENEEAKS